MFSGHNVDGLLWQEAGIAQNLNWKHSVNSYKALAVTSYRMFFTKMKTFAKIGL